MKFITTLSAAALAAFSFAAPVKASDYSDCVAKFGNTSCAALILSATSCTIATYPRIAHWSADKKADKAFEYVQQAWDEAGVNFDRIDVDAMIRLAGEFTDDHCERPTDKRFPSRNTY